MDHLEFEKNDEPIPVSWNMAGDTEYPEEFEVTATAKDAAATNRKPRGDIQSKAFREFVHVCCEPKKYFMAAGNLGVQLLEDHGCKYIKMHSSFIVVRT